MNREATEEALRQGNGDAALAREPGVDPEADRRAPGGGAPKGDRLIGRTVGGCEILSLVGRGSMGSVYRARQLSLGRIVALKAIRDALLSDEAVFLRFHQEARTVSRFNSRHVVQVHEVGVDDLIHFLIMEFVGGGNLGDHARKQPGKRLTPGQTLKFLAQASLGLLEAEKLQIIHRDIKPGNLLLDPKGIVKITDFGIAKVLESRGHLTSDTSLIGTPLYMSPEQARGESLDHRSDLYSLGATFYHLLTGRPPARGKSPYAMIRRKSELERLSPAAVLGGGAVPPDLNRIIERMTAQRREDRHANFGDLVTDLRDTLKGSGKAGRVAPAARPRPRRRRGVRPWLLGLAGLAGIAAALHFLAPPEWQPWSPSFLDRGERVSRPPPVAADPGPARAPEGVPPDRGPGDGDGEVDPAPEVKGGAAPGPAPVGDSESRVVASAPAPELTRTELASRVGDLRARLARAPAAELVEEARQLLEAIPVEGEATSAVVEELRGLLRDLEHGARVVEALRQMPAPEDLELAALDRRLPDYWKEIGEILAPPEEAGPELRAWLENTRERHGRELGQRVGDALRVRIRDIASRISRPGRGELAELRRDAAGLEAFRAEIIRLFPELRDSPRVRALEKFLAEVRGTLGWREIALLRARALEIEVEALRGILEAVEEGAPWTDELDRFLAPTFDGVRSDIDALSRRGQHPRLAALEKDLAAVEAWRERRGSARRLWRRAVSAFEAGRLSETTEILERLRTRIPDDDASRRLANATGTMVEGFRALFGELDLDGAEDAFRRARGTLEESRYPGRCLRRLAQLREVVRVMAPVQGGGVELSPTGSTVSVEGFFLDRREVTVREFREFLRQQRAVGDFESVRHLWPGEGEFRAGRRDPAYLSEESFVNPEWPIEEVNYFQARAFLLARGKDLPTLEEWWVAARGPLVNGAHRLRFPSFIEDIHHSAEKPVVVHVGGEARAVDRAHSVHHLAGNVAEWLRAPGEENRSSQLVGGRYLDDDEGYFTGERRDALELDDTRRGYGFRGVVRPREFFRALLPSSE